MVKKLVRKILFWANPQKIVIGSYISKQAIVHAPSKLYNVQLDRHSYIAPNSDMADVKIGSFCSIGPYCVAGKGLHPIDGITTSPVMYSNFVKGLQTFSHENKVTEHKNIVIGNDVFIGANVNIIDGVTIGDGAVVGAGCVVSKDVPPYAVVVGVPMKIIKYRFNEDQIRKLLTIKWWNFSEESIQDVEKYFDNVDCFIDKYYVE